MKKTRNPFRKAGMFLVDRLALGKPGKGNQELCQELTALSMGNQNAVREYYIKKAEFAIAAAVIGILAAGVCFFIESGAERRLQDQMLERPGYGEGDRNEELDVKIAGEEEVQSLEITVQERKYTNKEKDELFAQAVTELEKIIQGKNKSLDEVRQALVFPESLQNGAVTADWVTVPYGIVDEDGSIIGNVQEDGTLVELQATLTCGEKEYEYMAYAKIYPPDLTAEEKLLQSIRKGVKAADERDKYGKTVRLPDEVDGTEITWERPSENLARTVLALMILAVACIIAGSDLLVHQKAENRKNQLAIDYPDLMWKMAMLIGAGLTIRGAFTRIAFQNQKEQGAKMGYAYKEMAGACYEMESGIPEAEAYERFGRRCQLPEYIRLGSYLSQNLKKGSRGLAEFLEKEAASSLEERKNNARKMGEKAGTKLLFPMMLMLGIVLVVLMVPAFLSI